MFLIKLIFLNDPSSDIPPEYANAPVMVLNGLIRYVPGVLTAPTIVTFFALPKRRAKVNRRVTKKSK